MGSGRGRTIWGPDTSCMMQGAQGTFLWHTLKGHSSQRAILILTDMITILIEPYLFIYTRNYSSTLSLHAWLEYNPRDTIWATFVGKLTMPDLVCAYLGVYKELYTFKVHCPYIKPWYGQPYSVECHWLLHKPGSLHVFKPYILFILSADMVNNEHPW